MSPEQIRGDPIDARSDIYTLGVLLYEWIVGNVPYDSDNDEDILKAQIEGRPLRASLLVPNSPKWIDAFLSRALAESRSKRFQSIAAMARAMEVQIKAPPAIAPSKRQSIWRQRRARWVTSTSKPLLIVRNRLSESLTAALTIAMKMGRPKYALNLRVRRLGTQPKKPITSTKRLTRWRQSYADWMSSTTNSLSIIRNRMSVSFVTALALATKIGRQVYAFNSRLKRLNTEPKNPMAWTKWPAVWRRNCTKWLSCVSDPLFITANRLLKSLKANPARAPETAWKRFALLTFLLVSVTLGGANMLQAPNHILRPSSHLNDAVDAMFVRIKRDPITISKPDNIQERQAMVVKPINERPKAPEPHVRRPATSKNQPEASPWTTSDRARRSSPVSNVPEKPNIPAAVKEPSVSEPVLASRNTENNPAKTQLNIKWEN